MDAIKHHILVCCSFRTNGTPQGICSKKGAPDLLGYIEGQLVDRGLDGVQVSSTGCLKVCDRGPAMAIYPQNVWYGNVKTEDDVDAILDALENDEIAEAYRIG
jgi:(2Fe-2S) ferredoxin